MEPRAANPRRVAASSETLMKMGRSPLFVWLPWSVCLAVFVVGVRAGVDVNMTRFLEHRQQRSLTFTPRGGNIKILVGPAFNLGLGDHVDWRTVVMLYNLHLGEYQMPNDPLYPWDKWESIFARSMQRAQQEFATTGRYTGDDSRLFVYLMLERLLAVQEGAEGRQCLQRAICENAQVQKHVGLFTELLDVVLTPGHEDIDESYREALQMGRSGADCLGHFEACPLGASLLDRYWHQL